jgi:serine/threonine protein kinase
MRPGDPFDLVGTILGGKYQVEALIDETDLSVVYRAVHTVWRRRVAIKAFKAPTADEDVRRHLLEAFVREGALLSELSERCAAICQARDVASLITPSGDWAPYMVLEWLEGETLERRLQRERAHGDPPRHPDEALRLLEPVAEALAVAHDWGIVHRDVKPGNVFVLDESQALRRPHRGPQECRCKLLDFGIARALHELSGGGEAPLDQSFTPAYGAPEQFSFAHGPKGPWSDVYALALVFVELVTGREPLGGGTVADCARRSCDSNVRPTPRGLGAMVSDDVEGVLRRALALGPENRFADAGDFWRALKNAVTRAAIDLSRTWPIPLSRRRRAARRHWGMPVAALAGAGAAGLVMQYWGEIAHAVAAMR